MLKHLKNDVDIVLQKETFSWHAYFSCSSSKILVQEKKLNPFKYKLENDYLAPHIFFILLNSSVYEEIKFHCAVRCTNFRRIWRGKRKAVKHHQNEWIYIFRHVPVPVDARLLCIYGKLKISCTTSKRKENTLRQWSLPSPPANQ